MARRRHARVKLYPRVIYGPHGASMTINGPSEWLMGWSATPTLAAAATAPPTPEKIPFPRAEIKRRLREVGVVFEEASADAELYRRLVNG
jgi:hypothetical protein